MDFLSTFTLTNLLTQINYYKLKPVHCKDIVKSPKSLPFPNKEKVDKGTKDKRCPFVYATAVSAICTASR